MFTKNFNSLPDSLIEATKKIMTESEKMSEASNEAPTINHLELSEEELNEIYVINSDVHGRIGRAGDKLRQAIGTTHNDSTHHRAIGAIDDLSHHLSIAHPEHRAILNQLKIAKQSLQRAANTSNNEEKAKHIETARQIHQKAQNLLRIHQNNNMQRLSQQGVNINSEFVPEEVNEALSPEAKKRRDKLKAEVRAAKDAYKQISKQAKSPKSGLAPLKTSVTPKEHESEDPEESARKHPIDRLRRIALSMKGGHFEYDNGEKHHISRDVARAIVKHYEVPSEQGGLKPFQKEKLQSEITKSHDHLMKHYKSISGTNESSFEPKKNGREMIIEKKPKKSSINEVLPIAAAAGLGAAELGALALGGAAALSAALAAKRKQDSLSYDSPTIPQDMPFSDPERMNIRNIEKDAMAKLKGASDQTKSYDMPDTSLSVRSAAHKPENRSAKEPPSVVSKSDRSAKEPSSSIRIPVVQPTARTIEMPKDQAKPVATPIPAVPAIAKSQAQASAQSQARAKSTTQTQTQTPKKGPQRKTRLPRLPSISLGRNNYAGALADPAGYSDVREAIARNMQSRTTTSSTIKNTIAARRAENLKTGTSHDPAGYQPAVDVQRAKDEKDPEVKGVVDRLKDVFVSGGGRRIPRPQ